MLRLAASAASLDGLFCQAVISKSQVAGMVSDDFLGGIPMTLYGTMVTYSTYGNPRSGPLLAQPTQRGSQAMIHSTAIAASPRRGRKFEDRVPREKVYTAEIEFLK